MITNMGNLYGFYRLSFLIFKKNQCYVYISLSMNTYLLFSFNIGLARGRAGYLKEFPFETMTF